MKKVSLETKNPAHGKLGPNWEGPYRIINCKRQGSYYLEALDGRKLEHPWNVEHLRMYYQLNASLNDSSPGRAYIKFVYICICSLFYNIILLLLWCDYGQSDGFACMYLTLYKALTHEYVPHL